MLDPPYTLRHYSASNAHTVHPTIPIGCTYPRTRNRDWFSHSCGGSSYTTFRYAHGLAINDGTRGYGSESQAQG